MDRDAYLMLLNRQDKKPQKPLKYRNIPTVVDERKFSSKKEATYYLYLKQQKKNGDIKDFECQVRFEIIPKTKFFRSVSYIADFRVLDKDNNIRVYDVKSAYTRKNPVWKIKQKLMYFLNHIKVEEV